MKSHPLLPTTNVKAQQPNPTQPNGPEPPRYKCFTYNPPSKQKFQKRNRTKTQRNSLHLQVRHPSILSTHGSISRSDPNPLRRKGPLH